MQLFVVAYPWALERWSGCGSVVCGRLEYDPEMSILWLPARTHLGHCSHRSTSREAALVVETSFVFMFALVLVDLCFLLPMLQALGDGHEHQTSF